MSGNEWPPLEGCKEGVMANIVISLPSSDFGKKKEVEVKYHASSLNSAYDQLRNRGLVVVTDEFNKLTKGPKMEVFQGEKQLGSWGLVKAAVKKPARGVIKAGENLPTKSLSGPISSSSLIPINIASCPGVNLLKRRRRQKLMVVVLPSNPCLFKSMCQKKKKKRGKRSKKSKGGKLDSDVEENVVGWNMVSSGKSLQKKKGFPAVKSEANKHFDRDAKVC